jgi:dTDP-4-dehydrorhamnose reductase/beta-phosphoglucomutase-like phosphatase (HAD superfamily)
MESKMNVVVFGASGIVGRSICTLLSQHQIKWIGTYNKHPFENSVKIDIGDKHQINTLLSENNITHCINCIAQRNVDICEAEWEKTLNINCQFVKEIVQLCFEKDIYFFHISTDYVFDGMNPPYSPLNERCPMQFYGRSKTLAEINIQEVNKNACVVRVPVLYTQRYTLLTDTVITTIGKKVMNKTKTHAEDNYFIRRPVFIDDFCSFIYDCLLSKKKGVFHFYNSKDSLTKYQIATLIGQCLSTDISHIIPQDTATHGSGRPYDTQLIDSQYDRGKYPETSIDEGILCCFKRFQHPRLDRSKAPSEPIFYILDLDGTLLDTDILHYNAYKKAFSTYGKEFCTWETYNGLLSIEVYCKEALGTLYDCVKQEKQRVLCEENTISFMSGAEIFLEWLVQTRQNFAIVTNTSANTVRFFQTKVPLLQKVTQWITREDVKAPKPDSEPYRTAVERFSRSESYILGVENTFTGFVSLKGVTSIIYIVTQGTIESKLLNKDAYFISTFAQIFHES